MRIRVSLGLDVALSACACNDYLAAILCALWSVLAPSLTPHYLLTAPGIEASRRSACRSRPFFLHTSMVWLLGLVDERTGT